MHVIKICKNKDQPNAARRFPAVGSISCLSHSAVAQAIAALKMCNSLQFSVYRDKMLSSVAWSISKKPSEFKAISAWNANAHVNIIASAIS